MVNSTLCYSPLGFFVKDCFLYHQIKFQFEFELILYIQAAFLTLLLEFPWVWFYLKQNKMTYIFNRWLIANLLTHPLVWTLWPTIATQFNWDWKTYILVCESFAIIVETIFYFKATKLKFYQACLLSLMANLFSWGAGMWLQNLFF